MKRRRLSRKKSRAALTNAPTSVFSNRHLHRITGDAMSSSHTDSPMESHEVDLFWAQAYLMCRRQLCASCVDGCRNCKWHGPTDDPDGLFDSFEHGNEKATAVLQSRVSQMKAERRVLVGVRRLLIEAGGYDRHLPDVLERLLAGATKGHVLAILFIENAYRFGHYGLKADAGKADAWVEFLAQGDSRCGQTNLGLLRARQGRRDEARKLLVEGAAMGCGLAMRRLEEFQPEGTARFQREFEAFAKGGDAESAFILATRICRAGGGKKALLMAASYARLALKSGFRGPHLSWVKGLAEREDDSH